MPQIFVSLAGKFTALDFPENSIISPETVSEFVGSPGNFKFSGFRFGLPVFLFPGRLLGGKGGFGSLLRAQKHWAKQTTNFDSSRDLTGRRLRQAAAPERLRTWVEERRQEDLLVAELRTEAPPAERETLPDVFVSELRRAGRDKRKLISSAIDSAPVAVEVPVKRFKRTTLDLEISSDSSED